MIEQKPYRLKNKIQNYAWGTKNEDAFIPRFLGELPEHDIPYAELWIGAHPNAPSTVIINNTEESLDLVIDKFPHEILGKKVIKKFGNKLPYLLKVLSCETALSIQSHPDKELAKKLHSKDPKNYPDENHKPEIAVAIDNLKALIGFKPFGEVISSIERYPSFLELIPSQLFSEFKKPHNKSTLKELYAFILKLDQEKLERVVKNIKQQIIHSPGGLKEEEEFIKQYEIYGVDVGLLSILLFNIVELNEEEAVFTDSGIPHAYLKGNIIECMANSDNVIRAGLTPKFKDVETLLEMLSYDDRPVKILRPTNTLENIYKTPAEEFELTIYTIKNKNELKIETDKIIIGLVMEGEIKINSENNSEKFIRGQSFLIPAILSNFKMESVGNSKIVLVRIPVND